MAKPSFPSQEYRTSPHTVIKAAPAWDAVTATCHGVVASTRLNLYTALQGAFTLPQRKIVKVTQTYERGTWRWTAPNADGSHDFTQCYYAAFIEQPSSSLQAKGIDGSYTGVVKKV